MCSSDLDGGEEGPADLVAEAFGEGVDVLVVIEVGGAEECGFGVEVEGDVVFEEEGACEVLAWGDVDGAAALGGAGVDGFLDGGGIEGFAVGGSAVVFDIEGLSGVGGGGEEEG